MCGIAGILTSRPDRDIGTPLGAMLRALRHRGPDDEGMEELALPGGWRLGLAQTAGSPPAARRLAAPILDQSRVSQNLFGKGAAECVARDKAGRCRQIADVDKALERDGVRGLPST